MFESLFATTATTTSLGISSMLAAICAALILGLAISWVYTLRSRATRSFVLALAILPAIVAVVIMMVNGIKRGSVFYKGFLVLEILL